MDSSYPIRLLPSNRNEQKHYKKQQQSKQWGFL